MKTNKHILLAIAITAVITTAQAATTQEFARVLDLSGPVRVNTDGQGWDRVVANQRIPENSLIQTSDKGTIDIQICSEGTKTAKPMLMGIQQGTDNPATTVHLEPNTVLNLVKLERQTTGIDPVETIQLDLRMGKIIGRLSKTDKASQYQVAFPKGAAVIKASGYTLDSFGDAQVFDGQMLLGFEQPNGILKTHLLTSWATYSARNGEMAKVPKSEQNTVANDYRSVGYSINQHGHWETHNSPDHTKVFISPDTGN